MPEVPVDPLKFRDERRYTERLRTARDGTGLDDAVMSGGQSQWFGGRGFSSRFQIYGRFAWYG